MLAGLVCVRWAWFMDISQRFVCTFIHSVVKLLLMLAGLGCVRWACNWAWMHVFDGLDFADTLYNHAPLLLNTC